MLLSVFAFVFFVFFCFLWQLSWLHIFFRAYPRSWSWGESWCIIEVEQKKGAYLPWQASTQVRLIICFSSMVIHLLYTSVSSPKQFLHECNSSYLYVQYSVSQKYFKAQMSYRFCLKGQIGLQHWMLVKEVHMLATTTGPTNRYGGVDGHVIVCTFQWQDTAIVS